MKRLAILLALLLGLSACTPTAPLASPEPDTPTPVSGDSPAPAETSAPGEDTPAVIDWVRPERLASGPKQGTYYEVFVRSFADSDGDGIGDFAGLTSKLDYLEDLGVTGLWLMPCFESPSYHGYDTQDYYAIESDYGTMEDFEAFIAESDRRGIAVILDLVVNHTSTKTEWFKSSADPESPYRDWYRWSDGQDGVDLNASFYENKIWTRFGEYYYAGLFWDQMPDLNLDNAEVRTEIKNIAKFWLDKGVSGFRLDAAMHVYNRGELTFDAPPPEQSNLEWWAEFTEYCRSVMPDCYIVGEVWDAPGVRAPYVAWLDSVFHFDMGETLARMIVAGNCKGNAFPVSMKLEYDRLAEVNPDAINAPFLSNHDQTRISTALSNKPENLKMAASVYLTMQGLPFVYYGEELGMIGGKPDENIRTPFLWDDDSRAAWHDTVYNSKLANWAEQSADPDSLLWHYKRLMNLRAATPALYAGVLEPVDPGNDRCMAYTMTAPEQSVLVLHNLSAEPQTSALSGTGKLLFATTEDGLTLDGDSIVMPPKCSVIIEL